jgi:hypothetical protein
MRSMATSLSERRAGNVTAGPHSHAPLGCQRNVHSRYYMSLLEDEQVGVDLRVRVRASVRERLGIREFCAHCGTTVLPRSSHRMSAPRTHAVASPGSGAYTDFKFRGLQNSFKNSEYTFEVT